MRQIVWTGGGFEDAAAYSSVVRPGDRIVTSGTAALGADGTALHPGDCYAQTRHALATAAGSIVEFGGKVDDVTRSRLYLVPDADWRGAVKAYQEAFGGDQPSQHGRLRGGLISCGALVEVELEAELK